jgi:NAD(P)-dependent dehydrogenase (short-subunit alcohol dehydrogenase family)
MIAKLYEKVAIVTGGATGIGEAISHKFSREGACVLVNGLPGDPVMDVVLSIKEGGGEAAEFIGDISTEQGARDCVAACVKAFGRVNVLINNAGVFLTAISTEEYPLDVFDQTLRANIRSAFLMTKFALPHLQECQGNIVSAGSEAGHKGLAYNTPYGGTKAWMHAFMCGVAIEQAKYGVRANCVCPGPIDTAWTHHETGPMDRKMEKHLLESTPMGRRGTPEEVANVYCFLASDEASYVTGALWTVDGGITSAKGNVGAETPKEIRKPPIGELRSLTHSLDGLKNKEIRYH